MSCTVREILENSFTSVPAEVLQCLTEKLSKVFNFVNLTHTRVTWEEETSVEELSLSV